MRKFYLQGPMALLVSLFIFSCEDDKEINKYEPNDSFEKASVLSCGDSIKTRLEDRDMDWFTFQIDEYIINVNTISIKNLNEDNKLKAVVYNQYKEKITDSISKAGGDIEFNFTSKNDEFYLKIHSENSKTGKYSLCVKRNKINDIYEGNDNIETSEIVLKYPREVNGITLPTTYKGEKDKDYFALNLKIGKQVNIFFSQPVKSDIFMIELFNYDYSSLGSGYLSGLSGEEIVTISNPNNIDLKGYVAVTGMDLPIHGAAYQINFKEKSLKQNKKRRVKNKTLEVQMKPSSQTLH